MYLVFDFYINKMEVTSFPTQGCWEIKSTLLVYLSRTRISSPVKWQPHSQCGHNHFYDYHHQHLDHIIQSSPAHSIVADRKKFKEQSVCIGTECGCANIMANIAAGVECQIPSAVRKQQEMEAGAQLSPFYSAQKPSPEESTTYSSHLN